MELYEDIKEKLRRAIIYSSNLSKPFSIYELFEASVSRKLDILRLS